jgi:hypothetical protein
MRGIARRGVLHLAENTGIVEGKRGAGVFLAGIIRSRGTACCAPTRHAVGFSKAVG